ncbi:hypothetical protein PM082_006104 [Marasmius tenuissimus]|nr:hypothetical protein PM082_006104 [Marasmius tenuissimus]
MPRPKLYLTKDARREANRAKNQRFYKKNRDKILDLKKEKRIQEKRAQEKQEIRARKKRREQRNRDRKPGEERREPDIEVPVPTLSTADVEKELEGQMEVLKQHYQNRIQHDHRAFLGRLSEQALEWKKSTKGSIMTKNLSPSPVVTLKKEMELMLDQYHGLEDEYFYCLCNRKGRTWEDKRAEFTVFREVVSKLTAVLDNMEEMLHIEGYTADLDDLKDMYRYQY